MQQWEVEMVELERIRREALCILIRHGLGTCQQAGPQRNILLPESRVAWATIANELAKVGYRLVPPAEYAGAQGKTTDEVTALMEKEGTLFALCYGDLCLVPMPEREVVLPEIEG